MKLRFVNSAFIDAPARAILRGGRWRDKRRLRVRYGLLEHPQFGLILIDTGYSAETTSAVHRSRALRLYNQILKPDLRVDGDIDAVLSGLGFGRDDVTKIILTHFHADHVSALNRFPNADLITNANAYAEVMQRSHFANLRHGIFRELLPESAANRMTDIADMAAIAAPRNLGQGRDLFGDGSVLAIDLPGHAGGHFGLCFPGIEDGLLYACDVQWINAALEASLKPPLLSRLVSDDRRAAEHSRRMVAAYAAAGGKVILCHDPDVTEFDLAQVEDA